LPAAASTGGRSAVIQETLMSDEHEDGRLSATDRVIKLEEELEASGVPTLDHDSLAAARALLHEWVDSVVATVVSPGLGRVTLIHANGGQSTITSPDLPFTLSKPVGPRP
jgi:hypothetical protein